MYQSEHPSTKNSHPQAKLKNTESETESGEESRIERQKGDGRGRGVRIIEKSDERQKKYLCSERHCERQLSNSDPLFDWQPRTWRAVEQQLEGVERSGLQEHYTGTAQ